MGLADNGKIIGIKFFTINRMWVMWHLIWWLGTAVEETFKKHVKMGLLGLHLKRTSY